MFSKAKRFEPLSLKNQTKETKQLELEKLKPMKQPESEKVKPTNPPEAEKVKPTNHPESEKVKPTNQLDLEKLKLKKQPEPAKVKPIKQTESEKLKPTVKAPAVVSKLKFVTPAKATTSSDVQSQCSSIPSIKSFLTPKPVTNKKIIKAPSSLKKPAQTGQKQSGNKIQSCKVATEDIIKAQDAEIRNKDYTINEYNKQIEELKNEIANLQKQMKETTNNVNATGSLNQQLSEMSLKDTGERSETKDNASKNSAQDDLEMIAKYELKIAEIELLCEKLELEVSSKQVELTSLEEVITIRDSLCQDLQEKLSNMESVLEETRCRLEMVKGHHALALEANESIRREYKAELESLKSKFEEEKQAIVSRSKTEQDSIREHYNIIIESIKNQLTKEKDELLNDLQQQLAHKDNEMKAKLEQIDEATHEKLRLCEIQFEERSRSIQEHWTHQQEKIFSLEKETKDLKYSITIAEQKNQCLQRDFDALHREIEILKSEKGSIFEETNELKDETKKKIIDFENEINKLTVEVDKTSKEKRQFEMSLSVTRDIVQVLTMRLRESDNELEHLEEKVKSLTNDKEALENELSTYKNSLNNALLECNEYKEALVNILKSKAALAKEHTRIMEHNVTLIESLQNVEKEAYRELGTIQSELIEDVEMIKKESKSQIKVLQDEVEKKHALCTLATEQAAAAAAGAEAARALLAAAAAELARLDADNRRLQAQIQDQQSLVVELSLLRQENEELTMTAAKQSSLIDKLKKDAEAHVAPKSPSVMRKTHKIGKENLPAVISPLRERNH
ncbi:golgin subfamily A member 4-like [Cydia pomonella]|uniref:golgin subfamily A member 4-like n=1 Tax=Cydia pomonella TaxID=82600 RepID=UPI002ADDF630|nr:golgin subfamily A member 4-like [Cydia pomonella]